MRAPKTLVILACLAGVLPGKSQAGPYAVQIVAAQGPFGPSPYSDTNAVLGAPSTRFYDPFGGFGGGVTNPRVKLVEAAFNIAPDTNGLITPHLITTLNAGSHIIARFDQPVRDDAINPYGVDFLVFGNAFYSADVLVTESTDLNKALLTGGPFSEPIKVSVSPGYTGQADEDPDDPNTWPWYRYDAGPYGDSDFPTHAWKWNRATTNWSEEVMDFTKPVNPALKEVLAAGGMSLADAIDLYVGSGGGTGFDLKPSGFPWIQYVKVEGIDPDFSGGEIDAFSIVRPMTVGDELSIAPENITNNTAMLFFRKAGQISLNAVSLDFSALSDVAKISTAPLDDPSALAPLPGTPLNAVRLSLSSLPGTNAVAFRADLGLSAGESYDGNGDDLEVVQWNGSNWVRQAFTFDSTNNRAHVAGVTNLAAFVVFQVRAPQLSINRVTGSFEIQFIPVPGWEHTLERTTDFQDWATASRVTPAGNQVVTWEDNTPPAGWAFYRLHLERR
ncbi:MAG TPA: hypothetical protein VJW76_04230 [Verrucomicrobiae bacterium]|nr:hypothetical protein [Verrucomicrobiae bacterium]